MRRVAWFAIVSMLSCGTSLFAQGRDVAAGGGQSVTYVFGFSVTKSPTSEDVRGHIYIKNLLSGAFLEAVPVCAAISETPTRDPAVTIGRARIVATVTSGNLLPPGSNIFVSAQDSDPVDQFGYMQAPFSDCISGADVGAGEPVLRGNVLVRDHNGIAK